MNADPTLGCINHLEDLIHQKVMNLRARNTSFKTIASILLTLQKLLQVKSATALVMDPIRCSTRSSSHQLLESIHQSLSSAEVREVSVSHVTDSST